MTDNSLGNNQKSDNQISEIKQEDLVNRNQSEPSANLPGLEGAAEQNLQRQRLSGIVATKKIQSVYKNDGFAVEEHLQNEQLGKKENELYQITKSQEKRVEDDEGQHQGGHGEESSWCSGQNLLGDLDSNEGHQKLAETLANQFLNADNYTEKDNRDWLKFCRSIDLDEALKKRGNMTKWTIAKIRGLAKQIALKNHKTKRSDLKRSKKIQDASDPDSGINDLVIKKQRISGRNVYPDEVTMLFAGIKSSSLKTWLSSVITDALDSKDGKGKLADLQDEFYADVYQLVSGSQFDLTQIVTVIKNQKYWNASHQLVAMRHRYNDLINLDESQTSTIFSQFIGLIFKTGINKNSKVWKSWEILTGDKTKTFCNIVLHAREVYYTLEEVSKLKVYFSSYLKDDLFYNNFYKVLIFQQVDIKLAMIKEIIEVDDYRAPVLVNNTNELFSKEIIEMINLTTFDGQKIKFMMKLKNVHRRLDKFMECMQIASSSIVIEILNGFCQYRGLDSLDVNYMKQQLSSSFSQIRRNQGLQEHLEKGKGAITSYAVLNEVVQQYLESNHKLSDKDSTIKVRADINNFLEARKLDVQYMGWELNNKDFVEKVCNAYNRDHSLIWVYDWQRLVVSLALEVFLKQRIVFLVPVGHGKTIICLILARCIAANPIKQVGVVYIITLNEILKEVMHAKYAWKIGCGCYPDTQDQEIVILTFEEFNKLQPSQLKNSVVIFDEIEQSLSQKGIEWTTKVKDGGMSAVAHFKQKNLMKMSRIIGFSGTVTSSSMQVINVGQTNPFLQCVLKPIVSQADSIFETKLQWKKQEEIYPMVLDHVKSLIEAGKHVIVIDDDLEDAVDSFLKKDPDLKNKTKVFTDWSQENIPQTIIELGSLRQIEDPTVIHTNGDGRIGVDFAFEDPAHVVCMFTIKDLTAAIQAIGRGTRRVDHTTQATYLEHVDHPQRNIPPDKFLDYLRKSEVTKNFSEIVRQKVGERIHGIALAFDTEKEFEEFREIFDEKLPLYFVDKKTDPNASDNYSILCSVYEANRSHPLPATPMDLINMTVTTPPAQKSKKKNPPTQTAKKPAK